MPEGVLHLVACWASFVVVALLFAVMFQLFAIARGHNALQRVGDISLRPTSNSAPKRLHLSLIEKLWPPSTQNQCYSTCSIAAGIFATDISDRATWLNN